MGDDQERENTTPGNESLVVRRIFAHDETPHLFKQAGLPNRDVINYKAIIASRLLEEQRTKSGVLRDDSAVGRRLQAAGSLLTPGNLSRVTNPRSAVFGLISPGGGGGGRLGRGLGGAAGGGLVSGAVRRAVRAQLRCPAGYENGGRFATSGFANCGRILFELPNPRLRGLIDLNSSFLRAPMSEAMMRALGGGALTSQTIQIQRQAQIPRVAGPDPKRIKKAFDGIVSVLEANPNARFMARRDGLVLAPAVTSQSLAQVRRSLDMEGASFFAGVPSPNNIGSDHAPLIWQNKVRALHNVLPGGGTVTLEATKELTNGDRRRLGRLWAQKISRSKPKPFDGGDRLREIADLSNGALVYRENIADVDNANDIVTASRGTEKAQVRRWVYEKFMSVDAPGRQEGAEPWKMDRVAEQSASTAPEKEINSLEDAIAHLNDGGSLADIAPELISRAVAGSKKYKESKGKNRTTLYDGGRGNKWIKTPAKNDFEFLSRRISSDMQNFLGLKAGKVVGSGKNEMRDSFVEDARNIVDGALSADPIRSANLKDLMVLAMSDFLLDNRGRTLENLATASVGKSKRTFSLGDPLAGGAGLSADELRARRVDVLGAWYDRNGIAYNGVFANVSQRQRQVLLEMYNDTIKRAEEFRWEEYMKRLLVDGKLTKPEQVRMELMKDVFNRRLSTLRASKARLFEFVGISE